MPGNKLSVRDAQRLKGRCFLINIKAIFTTSWPNCKTKHKVPHSGQSPEFHSPNMKNITHITSLTRSGTCSLDLVDGKRWGPWTIYINWSSICSLSKEEHGSTFSHFRVGIMGVTCETEQASRGAGSASSGSLMEAQWEKYTFIPDKTTSKRGDSADFEWRVMEFHFLSCV